MKNESFDLIKFTEQYLDDSKKWFYLYYRTFFDLKELVDVSIDIEQFFVQEVSVSEMLSIIEANVSLDWFLAHKRGAAYIRFKDQKFEVYYEGERGSPDEIIGHYNDLRTAVLVKLKKDLFWISVKLIKD
jgi:hypothetical protein